MSKRRRVRYALPPPGASVLALSTLGIGPGGDVREVGRWTMLARSVRRQGRDVVALIPCDRAGAPEDLRKVITLVPWEAAAALRALRGRRSSDGGRAGSG
jgi:hypothetical protein